jgi:hypothetical protein
VSPLLVDDVIGITEADFRASQMNRHKKRQTISMNRIQPDEVVKHTTTKLSHTIIFCYILHFKVRRKALEINE